MFQEKWVFIGNPGTGKSTLLNCLSGASTFKSGLNFGAGLTQSVETYAADNGVVYIDTPGLSDVENETATAGAITSALRLGGRFKLCFVVRLENGRVVAEDLATVERVLDSIQLSQVPFAFIVNNIGPTVYKVLSSHQDEFRRVVTLLNSGKYSTPHILFIPCIRSLEQADNQRIDPPNEIRTSIERFPTVDIPPSAVRDIWTASSTQTDRLKEKLQMVFSVGSAMEDMQANLAQSTGEFWEIALAAVPIIFQIGLVLLTA